MEVPREQVQHLGCQRLKAGWGVGCGVGWINFPEGWGGKEPRFQSQCPKIESWEPNSLFLQQGKWVANPRHWGVSQGRSRTSVSYLMSACVWEHAFLHLFPKRKELPRGHSQVGKPSFLIPSQFPSCQDLLPPHSQHSNKGCLSLNFPDPIEREKSI